YLASAIGGTPPPPPSTIATDTWSRTVANGWGTATTGGAWTVSGTNTAYAADGSSGSMTMTSISAKSAVLGGPSALNVDETFSVASDKVVVGSGQYAYAVLRHQASGAEYWGKIHFSATGGVYLAASAFSGSAETSLGAEVASGLVRVPGTAVNVRFQAIGTSPTTIRGRAWAVGTTEPTSWTFTATDSTAALQAAGSIGLRATLSSTSTNLPITFRFDNLTVLDLGTGATPSVARGPALPVADRPSSRLTMRTATANSGRLGQIAR
ncbi:MAG TPA: hypothetical protein VIB99_03385, partial [Candidatus Limnocylindrales bacterium]